MKIRNFKIVTILVFGLVIAGYYSASYVKAQSMIFLATPTNIVVNPISTSSVTISWDGTTNPLDTDYGIFVVSNDTSTPDSMLIQVTGTSTQLTNLSPNTDYKNLIIGTLIFGSLSNTTTIPNFHTLTNTPPITSPISLTTTASTTNSITLQWDTNNSAIGTAYQISGADFTTTTATSTGTATMTTTINNLSTPDTQYIFNVQSQNIDRTLNSAITTSDYTKAANPINLIASNITTSSLTLSWNANGNPSSTLYNISDTSSSLGVANTTTFDISSLSPSTTYTFNVLSYNKQSDKNPNSPTSITTSTISADNQNNNVGGSSGSGNPPPIVNTKITDDQINTAVDKLIAFLKNNQNSDGSISDSSTSDWSAMAFASKGIYAADVKNGASSLYDFIYNYNINLLETKENGGLEDNNCTAYSRHILAMLASGVSKNDNKITTLKTKLDACAKNNKFGLDGINDDVFGSIALISIGETISSPAVTTALNGIKSDQQADGSFTWSGWPGADITGAAINALKYAQNNGAVVDKNIFTKAEQYLKTQQHTDGAWGCYDYNNGCIDSDVLTTSWALMGINSLGETQTDWFNATGTNPWYILKTLDNDHFTPSWGGIDWFGTKHAVPAFLGKSWPIILTPRVISTIGMSGGNYSPTPTPTTINTSTTTTTTLSEATSTALANNTTPSTTEITTTTIVAVEKTPLYITKKLVVAIKKADENNKQNTTTTQTSLSTGTTSTNKNQIVDELPLDTSTKRNMKKLLAISGGGTLVVGFWLARKLIKKVI